MNRLDLEHIYLQVRKNAKSVWSELVSIGKVGYLPSLDGIIQTGETLSEVNLGVVEVPLNKIIGTYTHSRSISFAHNFMPLMDLKSEFATKWINLYETHMEEGLRDPIKVYEYLNRFFVIEGNKRVSVLKCVGATSFNAQVIRIIPKRDPEDKINNIYYEFMSFYKITGVNLIWFSKEGSFKELLAYMNQYESKSDFSENKYKVFLANVYRPFRSIYHREGGGELSMTTGDAFLEYLKIYGLEEEILPSKHTAQIKQLIKEIEGRSEETSSVRTEFIDAPKRKNVLTTFTGLINQRKVLKIAFVYAKSPERSGWAYSHELGRLHINNIFKDQVETTKVIDVPENEDAYTALKKLAEEKYDIIFTTSPTFIAAALKAAVAYPEVKFFNCAATSSYKSLPLYFGRIHEPRYILGMLAGTMTQTGIIGYVAPYPIPEVLSSINAFTLGAKAVNPRAKVKIMWTYKWDNPELGKDVANKLIASNADIISNEDLPVPGEMSKEYGVYSIPTEGEAKQHLAMAMWDWGIFYEKVIRNIISGTWKNVMDTHFEEEIPMNFWLGMDTGIVDLLYSNRNIPVQTKQLIQILKNAIIAKEFEVFTGPIYDQDGKLRIETGKICSYEEVINMNWLVQGAEGDIPKVEDLDSKNPFLYMQSLAER